MRLLIVTQTLDRTDPVLGFFHRWVEEFAHNVDQVIVICLNVGVYELPENVRVLTLGKKEGVSRLGRLFRFYRYILTERNAYDTVFVHMNPEYVTYGGLIWRLLEKRIALWYTHRSVTSWLRAAARLSHTIFTASEDSFRVKSDKVHVVGHGIDTERFLCTAHHIEAPLELVAVGRISQTKRQDLAIASLRALIDQGTDARLTFIGTPLAKADEAYADALRTQIEACDLADKVVWRGAVENSRLPRELERADVLVHTSETGSLDKVVLEALALGVCVVTTSEAVAHALPPELVRLYCPHTAPKAIASLIQTLTSGVYEHELREKGRSFVETEHSLPNLIRTLISHMRLHENVASNNQS